MTNKLILNEIFEEAGDLKKSLKRKPVHAEIFARVRALVERADATGVVPIARLIGPGYWPKPDSGILPSEEHISQATNFIRVQTWAP